VQSTNKTLHLVSLVAVHSAFFSVPGAHVVHAWHALPSVEKVWPSSHGVQTVSLVVVHAVFTLPVPAPHVVHAWHALPSVE